MKRYLSFLVSVFFLKCSFAQIQPDSIKVSDQRLIVDQASAVKDVNERLLVINNALATKKITDRWAIAELYSLRAFALREKYQSLIGAYSYLKNDTAGSFIINPILKDYQTAMDTCPLYKPAHQEDRMNFLGEVNKYHPQYDKDVEELLNYGYKQDKTGAGFGANYLQGKESWLGMEVSIAHFVQPSYTLKNIDPEDGKKKKVTTFSLPVALSALTFGINKSLASPAYGFVISLIQLRAPVFVDPTKLCFTQNTASGNLVFSYRPEIGIGNTFFQIGYAYNFVFKKTEVNLHEKHMLVLRFSYPMFNYD